MMFDKEKRHPAQDLESEDVRCLGECVRDLVACLGYGTHSDLLEAVLFREAIDTAIYILTGRQGMRASLKEFREQRGYDLPEYLPITMEELAQQIIIHSDEERRSGQEMRSQPSQTIPLERILPYCTHEEKYLREAAIKTLLAAERLCPPDPRGAVALSLE